MIDLCGRNKSRMDKTTSRDIHSLAIYFLHHLCRFIAGASLRNNFQVI
jgi:hypothetical protein